MAKTAMRCPAADEDTPCAAEWAILTQVSRDRLSDVGRKRKLVVITSLATHREHTGPPIDIIEFQSDDFARSEPQAGQEQKDCVIPTSNRCAAIASLDHPFDFLRLKILRHFRQPPGSHGRNGPCEVTFGLSVSEEKPAEGTRAPSPSAWPLRDCRNGRAAARNRRCRPGRVSEDKCVLPQNVPQGTVGGRANTRRPFREKDRVPSGDSSHTVCCSAVSGDSSIVGSGDGTTPFSRKCSRN